MNEAAITISNAFVIPAQDTSTFAALRSETKAGVLRLLTIVADIHRMRRAMSLHKATLRAEVMTGLHHTKLRRAYEGYLRSGWRVLIDKRLESSMWESEESVRLPADFINYWHRLCEKYQDARGNKAAHRCLLRQLEAWRKGYGEPIPGYDQPPVNGINGDHPLGWSYTNLSRHTPTKVCLAAARIGRDAALTHLPGVYTTRVGLYAGQFIEFDDVWHNFLVNQLGSRTPVRLLEFRAVDVFSTATPKAGQKPRLEGDNGKNKILNQNDFRYFLAGYLTDIGWSPRGTQLCMELGTASIPQILCDRITALTGGKVTVAKNAILNAPALPGQQVSRGKGNPRFKALLEGTNGLIQREMSWLDGQVGKDRDSCPQEMFGLLKMNAAFADILAARDELAEQLRLPFVSFDVACALINIMYERVDARTEHKIEGWLEAGLVSEQYRLSQSSPWGEFKDLRRDDPDFAESVLERVRVNPTLYRTRKLSPAEVWQVGSQDFEHLPLALVPEIIGIENCRTTRVNRQLFTIEDIDLGPGKHRWLARINDELLPEGREFLTIPWGPQMLVIDKASGRYLGECAEYKEARRDQPITLRDAVAEARRVEGQALAPARARSLQNLNNRIADSLHNASVARTAEEKMQAAEVKRTLLTADAHSLQDLCESSAPGLLDTTEDVPTPSLEDIF